MIFINKFYSTNFMKRQHWIAILALTLGTGLSAQSKKDLDRQAILDMCGCYEITFKYTETFAPEIDYEKKLDYTAAALELALPIMDEDDRISIQHLLVFNDSMVIKHWRQDWLYENREIFTYNKDNSWNFATLPKKEVRGQWTQKVFQVDDSPRYSGSATWVHADGRHYWENATDSPLPRREYSKRSDYNVMKRGNRHEITEYGWVHEQDNDKIVREDGKEDILLVQEKGFNTYTRVADENCRLAVEWWAEHQDFWAKVRSSWDEIYDREGKLSLRRQVEGKPLFMHLYPLEAENAGIGQIAEVIGKFVIDSENPNGIEGK